MRRFDKTKNIIKANLLAEQRYLQSKVLINENEDNIEVVNSLDELKNKIKEAGFDPDTCLINECLEVIFNGKNPLEIIRNNQGYGSYFSHSDELAVAFKEKMEMVGYPVDLSIETINKLIILFIIIENSDSMGSVIKGTGNDGITIDTHMLYKYINLYDIEDGNILRRIDKNFVEKYKDLV